MGMMPLAQAKGRRGSYNIGEVNGATWNKIHGVLLRVKPRVVLIMNDAPRAYQLADELPDSIIILRFYHHTDGQFWQYFSPQAALAQAKAKGAKPHPRVYIDMNNEPSIKVGNVQNADTFKAWRDWEVQTSRAFAEAKIGYVTAIATAKTMSITGNWEADLQYIDDGIADPLIWEFCFNEYMLCGDHDYRPIAPHAEYLPNYPENLNDPWIFTQDAFKQAVVPHDRVNGKRPNNYAFERMELWQIRAMEKGWGRFAKVVTECVLDYAEDILEKKTSWSQGQTLKEFLKRYTGGRDVNGIQTTKPIWAKLQPTYSSRHIIKFLTDWMDANYSDQCLGWCWFTVSNKETKPNSPGWESFFVQDEDDLHEANESLPVKEGIGMTDAPDTKLPDFPAYPSANWETVTVRPLDSNDHFNVRSEPSTRGKLTTITRKVEVETLVKLNTKEPVENGGYTWLCLRFSDGTFGWAADTVFTQVVEATPDPEPEPEPEPTPEPEPEPTPVPLPDDKALYPITIYTQMWQWDEAKRRDYAYMKIAEGLAILEVNYWVLNAEQLLDIVKTAVAAAEKRATQEAYAVRLSEEKKPADKQDDKAVA